METKSVGGRRANSLDGCRSVRQLLAGLLLDVIFSRSVVFAKPINYRPRGAFGNLALLWFKAFQAIQNGAVFRGAALSDADR